MGRRTLTKIDPSLDLSRHWKRLNELPCPFDAAQYFGRSAPLELEMGSGKGWFIRRAAGENPQRNYVGIEYAKKYSRYAASRLTAASLSNALVIDGDGLQFFREYVPDKVADRVHVYFPDPWWKQRHRKRRVLNVSFLNDVQRVLKPAGRLVFWTDVQEYFEATLKLIRPVAGLGSAIVPSPPSPADDSDFHTHFERRTRLHEAPIYRAEFEKFVT